MRRFLVLMILAIASMSVASADDQDAVLIKCRAEYSSPLGMASISSVNLSQKDLLSEDSPPPAKTLSGMPLTALEFKITPTHNEYGRSGLVSTAAVLEISYGSDQLAMTRATFDKNHKNIDLKIPTPIKLKSGITLETALLSCEAL